MLICRDANTQQWFSRAYNTDRQQWEKTSYSITPNSTAQCSIDNLINFQYENGFAFFMTSSYIAVFAPSFLNTSNPNPWDFRGCIQLPQPNPYPNITSFSIAPLHTQIQNGQLYNGSQPFVYTIVGYENNTRSQLQSNSSVYANYFYMNCSTWNNTKILIGDAWTCNITHKANTGRLINWQKYIESNPYSPLS